MVLPSIVLLASLVTVGFAAPKMAVNDVEDVITAIGYIAYTSDMLTTDIKNYPYSTDVSFFILFYLFFCVSFLFFFD